MTEETAGMIVMGITAVGIVAWIAGFATMLRASRAWSASSDDTGGFADREIERGTAAITGAADIAGQPEALASKLGERLAGHGLPPFGPVKIVACNHREVVFEPSLPGGIGAGNGCPPVRHGIVRFSAMGGTTHVEYVVTIATPKILIGFGWLAVAAGLAALILVPWLTFTYALPSANTRPQVIQTFQMVHFLWPPFLFAKLSQQSIRIARAQLDALIHNLPYV